LALGLRSFQGQYTTEVNLLMAASLVVILPCIVLFFFAASLGPITLVSAISITIPLVVLLFATVISRLWPKVLAEEIDAKTMGLKVLAIALIVVGIYLIL
jgi:positive regulator of sigma E activity